MDSLTGLHDRDSLLNWGRAEVHHSVLDRFSLTLMALDLDHFEMLIAMHGREFGDTALRAAADAIRGVTNDCNYLARTGGANFVVVFPKTSSNEAEAVSQEVFNTIKAAMRAFPPTSPSAGVACFEKGGLDSSFDCMLRCAFTLNHSARLAGTGNIVYKCYPSNEIMTDNLHGFSNIPS